jgi:glutamate-1-semialdehyde aminotransferase
MDRWTRTKKVIPLGVQTLSKQPNRHTELYPKYIDKAKGCYVWSDKKRYIDYPCALGTILLGYSFPSVDNAVKRQLEEGILYSIPSFKETILAEKLCELIPCAEMVRFLKTGSEAVSASIKIARSYTKREHIASFGYHGWHDWCQVASEQDKGIPRSYKKLMHQFEYNNIESLIKIFQEYEIAAVILEPYVYEPPKNNFLSKVIEVAHRYGALVIFDEIVSGFRTPKFSAQAYFNAIPDLATFGKAMANGYPMNCVVGKREYMKELEKDCFVSSTFGGDLTGISAALATIDFLEKNNVIDHIWKMGTNLQHWFNIHSIDLEMSSDYYCLGFPCRTHFHFPNMTYKSLFWQECIKKGVFFGHAQFITYSHTSEIIQKTLDVIFEALSVVRKNIKNPSKVLKGKPAFGGLRD